MGCDKDLLTSAAECAAVEENKFPEHIMRTLRRRRGLEAEDTSEDSVINTLSKKEAFESVLEWEGIIGYSYMIQSAIEDIYKINLDD